MTNIFENRSSDKTPTWFMRQAGRYHCHYQGLKEKHTFMELCKNPELACEVTMGPIEDFGFDAAILFSDLLFPLEQMGMGLSYESGPPTLEFHLEDHSSYQKLKIIEDAKTFYRFQAEATTLLKKRLPEEKTLLGFVGAPFTLYTYATEGGHKGNLISSKKGLYDGRFGKFLDILLPELFEEISIQLSAGADAICLFDTAVGELSLQDFKKFISPVLQTLTSKIKKSFPDKKIIYYSKLTHLHYLQTIESDSIDVIGVDWRVNLATTLKTLGKDYYIQGNIDPVWLHLERENLMKNLDSFKKELLQSEAPLEKWIAGLGHGVLPKTPEENVRAAVKFLQGIKES